MTGDPSEAESWPFPVLGIPPERWGGARRLALRSAVGARGGASVTVAVSHAYYVPGQRLPAVVLGQAPAYPGRTPGSNSAVSILLRSKERPSADEPAETVRRTIEVAGADLDAMVSRWRDTRIQQARFDWLGRRVEIAAWRLPLDNVFFALLGRLEIGS